MRVCVVRARVALYVQEAEARPGTCECGLGVMRCVCV